MKLAIRGIEDRHFTYQAFDAFGELLYIGYTRDPEQRLKQHKKDSEWYPLAVDIICEEHPDKRSALDAERALITENQPPYNSTYIEKPVSAKINLNAMGEQARENLEDAAACNDMSVEEFLEVFDGLKVAEAMALHDELLESANKLRLTVGEYVRSRPKRAA